MPAAPGFQLALPVPGDSMRLESNLFLTASVKQISFSHKRREFGNSDRGGWSPRSPLNSDSNSMARPLFNGAGKGQVAAA